MATKKKSRAKVEADGDKLDAKFAEADAKGDPELTPEQEAEALAVQRQVRGF